MSQATQSPGFSRQTTVSVGAPPKPAAGKPRQPRLAPKTTPFPGLSFVTDQRGRTPRRVWFDVPAEPFTQGYVTGLRAAEQLIAALRRQERGVRGGLREILAAVFAEQPARDRISRNGARVAFLGMVSHMLTAAAGQFDWSSFVADGINEMAQCEQWEERHKAQKRDAFVARMQAAKAAKRAAQGARHV